MSKKTTAKLLYDVKSRVEYQTKKLSEDDMFCSKGLFQKNDTAMLGSSPRLLQNKGTPLHDAIALRGAHHEDKLN